jgi:hypothetical protein
MQKRNNKKRLEDLGGKSEPNDESIEDVVKRETLEELNCFSQEKMRPKNNPITAEFLDSELPDCEQILIPEHKYVLCIVQLPHTKLFDLTQYLNAEYDTNGVATANRRMVWISKKQLCKSQLHPRIRDLHSFLP